MQLLFAGCGMGAGARLGRPRHTDIVPTPYLTLRQARPRGGRPAAAAHAAAATDAKPRGRRPTAAVLEAQLEQLRAENESLRQALASYQGRPQADESEGAPAEPHAAAAAAPAGAATAAAQPAGAGAPAGVGGAAVEAISWPSVLPWGPPSAKELEEGIQWPSPGEEAWWDRAPRRKPALLSALSRAGASARDPHPMHVVHITAELAPLAKVGGLGDVVTGLAKACLARGHSVEIMLPFYECLPVDEVEDLQWVADFDCPKGRVHDGQLHLDSLRTQVYQGKIEGCPVLLVRPDWDATGSNLFKGDRIYGGSYNEAEAYLYFSRACLEFMRNTDRQPDIVHIHEWQACAVPMLFWETFHQSMPRTRIVMTIHNMDSSGECKQDDFSITGIGGDVFARVDRALDERTIGHNPERLCLLKGGIVYSNAVTTVSPNYARETLHGGASGWLKATLALPHVSAKYSGVLNGIDTTFWDPACDDCLPACYSSSRLEGKALCKHFLQQGLGLEVDPSKPLVVVIARLVPQKGIHLIEHAVHRTLELGGQFVVLGTGHADGGLRAMADGQYRDNPNVAMRFMYSERLAHQIYAAADLLLVPSIFEPCGLTQMIALRYGAIPVVRSTGGLADTVKDVDQQQQGNGSSGGLRPNGFVFDGIDAGSLNSALDRALQYYKERPEWWGGLCEQVMEDSVQFSWDQAASTYVDIYSRVASA